ncbi:RAD55 family ATPase [Candidatus Altiarchaeota archaeon]
MEKIKTGVKGLDEMLNGGLVKGRPYIISGGAGVGKTVLSMQFLMEGVANGEKCVYIALEEQASQIKEDMLQLGWDVSRIRILDTMQDLGTGTWTIKTTGIITKPELNLKNLIEEIRNIMVALKPTRIVIDSLTSLKMLYENPIEIRRGVVGLMNFLTVSGITTLLTSELSQETSMMEEFLASGVIRLDMIENEGERLSAINIMKMRGTDFDKSIRPLKITDKGIIVYPQESIYR